MTLPVLLLSATVKKRSGHISK